MILSLREGEILGLQPSDLDFDAADGRGTILVNKTMQRANKDALEKLDPNQMYHTFPDRREGSKSSLILKKPKTKKSNRVLYMTKPLKEELLAWLEKLKQDEQNAPEKYSNCGQLFRLPDGLPIAPELLTKWYRQWRSAHPEFEQIVFHGLRHSSATYQLLQSDGDFQVNSGKHWSCNRRCPDGHLRPHAGQAPVGADREDRSKLLHPRPDPGSTPAPAKRKAGGNKNLW